MRHLIHNEADPKWLLQDEVIEGLKLLAAAGLTFDVVATLPEHMECIPIISAKVPNLKMVIDHLGQPPIATRELGRWGDDLKAAAENPNVYGKISGLGTASGNWDGWTAEAIKPYVDYAIETFGPERCMVGGDWPVSVLAGGYGKAWAAYRSILAGYPADVQAKVLSGTAIRFYGLALPVCVERIESNHTSVRLRRALSHVEGLPSWMRPLAQAHEWFKRAEELHSEQYRRGIIDMRELTYTQALREALTEEMTRDPNILLLGEDIGLYGGVFKVTEGLLAKFGPERVRETPISESGFVGMGVGLAMTGKRPVAELMFMDFAWVASDQIFNQAAKMRYMSGGRVKVPLLIRTQQGGGRGNGAQHSQSLETIFTHIPGLKVVLPATPYDAKGLLKTALREDNPVIFIEHKLLYNTKGPVPEDEYTIPFGVAEVKRPGSDVTLVSYSRTLLHALEAAEEAAKEGISAEVIDLRTTAPLDLEAILTSVRKTGRLIIAHEAHRKLGLGAEIAALVQEHAFDYLDAPIVRVGAMDIPIPSSKPLEDVALPGKTHILQAIRQIVT